MVNLSSRHRNLKMKSEKTRIARNIHRGLHDGGVAQSKYGDCLKWAFGPNYNKVQIRQWRRHWNKLHNRKFKKDMKIYLMLKIVGREYAKLR